MENSVIEVLLKAKTTSKGWALRVGGGVLVLLAFVSFIFIGTLNLFLIALFGFLEYAIIQRTDLEYEYSYFDGEITIDKIMGKAKRKRLICFSLANCDVAAYEGSTKLERQNGPGFTVLDVTSGEQGRKRFVIVLISDGRKQKIIMEPTDKLADAMRAYAPNKVYLV